MMDATPNPAISDFILLTYYPRFPLTKSRPSAKSGKPFLKDLIANFLSGKIVVNEFIYTPNSVRH